MATAYSDGSLIFNTEIDPKGFNKGLKNLSKSARSLSGTLASIGKTFAGTLIGAGIVKGLTNLANQAIELSSDMKEVQNVVDTAFESMAYKAEEFADISIEQFGMSKLAAKQTASTYMAMGKSMGLSMEAASDMAVEVAKMTGDVASFYNLSQDLAATKLKSIWTGETETLKDLGVVMTEANLQQYALNQGITKSYSAMSQAEKVSLRYSYVMNALTDAQGDFAKTSNSWANQTRVLSERWKELLSILGGGLIRVLTPALTVINTILQALINLANGVVGYYRTFLNAMSLLVSIDWAGIWENAKNNAIEKLTTLRDNLNLLWISIRDTAKTKWNELKTNIVTTWDSIQTSMQTKWEAFKNGMSGLLTSMKTNSQNILNQITTFLKGTFSKNWETAWDGVALKLKSVWNGIVATIESAVNLIIDAINWCINQINKIHIDVPDWVTDLTGMDGFGFNIPNLNKVSIPRLATGAVIPPNGEFLAMLGDQKSGNNIEAPESLLRQIVREESGSGDIIINARGTMGQLIRLLKLEIEREDNRRGPTFTPGGAY